MRQVFSRPAGQGAGKGRATPTPPGALSRFSPLVRQALMLPHRERLAFIEKNADAIRAEYREIWGRLLPLLYKLKQQNETVAPPTERKKKYKL